MFRERDSASLPVVSHEPVDQVLEIFLAAGAWLWIDVLLFDAGGDLLEAALAREHRLGLLVLPAGIAVGEELVVGAVFDQPSRALEAAGQRVEPADMAVHQVDRIERLATDLGVEVEAAIAEAAILEDLI